MGAGGYYYLVSQASSPPAPKPKAKKAKASAANSSAAKAKMSAATVKVEDLPEDEDAEPTDPFEKALAHKNKGNKYFKGERYELAIKCYGEAIEV